MQAFDACGGVKSRLFPLNCSGVKVNPPKRNILNLKMHCVRFSDHLKWWPYRLNLVQLCGISMQFSGYVYTVLCLMELCRINHSITCLCWRWGLWNELTETRVFVNYIVNNVLGVNNGQSLACVPGFQIGKTWWLVHKRSLTSSFG